MKKSIYIIAITAIAVMLFTACAPQPASEEDIAAAKELISLVVPADEAGKIDYSDYSEGATEYTIKLKDNVKYEASNGDQLTAYTYSYKEEVNEGNPEASKIIEYYSVTGIINGKSHTVTFSGITTGENFENTIIKVTIDGKNIDKDVWQFIPG